LTASVAVPQPLVPANGAVVAYASQPVTLTVQNAVVTSTGGTTYAFEIATDAAFTNKVQTKDPVAEGGGGQTSVKLDALAGSTIYYWHARATSGGTTGLFGSVYKFTVAPLTVLNPPVPIAPLSGSNVPSLVTFRVTNAVRQGAVGALTYKFDIASDPGFASIIATGTVAEQNIETDFAPQSNLPIGPTLYWRATALDAVNNLTSGPNATQSFTARMPSQAEVVAAQLGQPLWPGPIQPPGTFGHATMGDNWQIQTLHHIPTNTFFQSPTIEMLQIFDLLDRGFDPDGAISWMNGNGYPTAAQWYPPPDKAVIGLAYVYLAARNKITVNGIWDIVLKAE